MPAPWSKKRNANVCRILRRLYVRENKTISEIANHLAIKEKTVYDRLQRLGIPSLRHKKSRFNNRNQKIVIPKRRSRELAEFVGILLGDGHLTPTQITVTLGTKERQYVDFVSGTMHSLFKDAPRTIRTKRGDWVVYLGSTELVRFFLAMKMAFNKVQSQVGIPVWCFTKKVYQRSVLRGLFDTDGSVYAMHGGVQISFCNHSKKLLQNVRTLLLNLGFVVSHISANKVYITRKKDVWKFYKEIGFSNGKHKRRFLNFMNNKVAINR